MPNRGRKALGAQLLGLAFLLSSPAPAKADFLLTDPGSVLYYRAAVVAGSEVRVHRGSEIAGDVLSNGDVDLHRDARVLGDATAAGTVGGHGTVTGVATSGAATVPLPSLDVPALLALADRTFTGRTTFSDAVIDDVVFVDGAVRIEGTLAGSGTVVALGDLELVGAGGGLDATSQLSLIASGDVRFAKDRAFRGAVWAGRDLTIEKNGTFEAVMVAGRRVKVKKDTTVTFLHLDPNPPHLTTLSPFDGELLATATPTISVAYSDDLSGVDLATLGLRLDGVEVTAEAEVTAGGLDFTPAEALAEGEHVVGSRPSPAPTAPSGSPACSRAGGWWGSTAPPPTTPTPGSSSPPTIDFPIDAIAGAENALHQVVLLPFLDRDNGRWVGGEEDVTLEMAGVAGFAVKVFAHSTLRPDGTRGPVWMSSSQVKHDRVPMSPPQGSTPLLVGTLQPAGIRFDPPAQVIYPNLEGLPPGEVADVFSFEHSLGQFVNVGPGTVSEDGSVVVSDPGFGLLESGWHCLLRFPGPAAECANGCSAQLEWQLLGPEGIDPGALRTAAPVRVYATPEHPGDTRASLRFRPEGGTFDPGGWSGGEPEVLRSEETAAGGTASVTLTAPGTLFGDTSITSPRYRFQDPDGTETSCRALVDVRVGGVQVVFDQDPAITGYTLLQGQPPLFKTVTATVAPVEMVHAVSFSTDRPDRATVEVAERNPMTGEITLQIYGATATPTDQPQGDARVVASLGEEELESAQVVVVVPTTQTHSVGEATLQNIVQSLQGGVKLGTRVTRIVSITVRDQFGSLLSSVYEGVLIVSEEFYEESGDFEDFPEGEHRIQLPNGVLEEGVILDQSSITAILGRVVALTAQQVNQWIAGTLMINEKNNAYSLNGEGRGASAKQKIRVHGHYVIPDYLRTKRVEPLNHPPIPYTVFDTAVE